MKDKRVHKFEFLSDTRKSQTKAFHFSDGKMIYDIFPENADIYGISGSLMRDEVHNLADSS